jgi:hypothetical protein
MGQLPEEALLLEFPDEIPHTVQEWGGPIGVRFPVGDAEQLGGRRLKCFAGWASTLANLRGSCSH